MQEPYRNSPIHRADLVCVCVGGGAFGGKDMGSSVLFFYLFIFLVDEPDMVKCGCFGIYWVL